MITLGRYENGRVWHIFPAGFQESLCGRVLWDCDYEVEIGKPEDVRGLEKARFCRECLKRAVQLAEVIEALNARVP